MAESKEITKINYVYELPTESLENPDRIRNFLLALPSGVRAKFIRSGGWYQVPKEARPTVWPPESIAHEG